MTFREESVSVDRSLLSGAYAIVTTFASSEFSLPEGALLTNHKLCITFMRSRLRLLREIAIYNPSISGERCGLGLIYEKLDALSNVCLLCLHFSLFDSVKVGTDDKNGALSSIIPVKKGKHGILVTLAA